MSLTELEYNKFYTVAKRINKESLSTNPETLNRYRTEIIEAFNLFLNFVNSVWDQATKPQQATLDNKLLLARQVLIKCFEKLQCTYDLPSNIYDEVLESNVGPISGIEKEDDKETQGTSGTRSASSADELKEIDDNSNEKIESDKEETESNKEEKENTEMDPITLFNAVNRQFNQKYSGDPLGLTSFIDGAEILETFANTAALKVDLFKFIKTKLDGRAREFITDDIQNIEQLKAKLRASIQPENSKVIEGRITSLRYTYSKQEDFAAKAEELSDALRRTLIIEGMTATKANEISVERTVELCRKSTNSDLVKSVLASTSFKQPKEVIAKLITESDVHIKEQKVLRYSQMTRDTQRGNTRGHSRNNFGNRGRGYQNNRNTGHYHNNQESRNGNFRGNGARRGRGNGHSQTNAYNNGYNNNRNNGYNQNRYNNRNQQGRNNNDQNILVTQAGNWLPPPELTLGAQQNR